MKKFMIAMIFMITMPVMADEAIPNSTEEWVEVTTDSDAYDVDGCFC